MRRFLAFWLLVAVVLPLAGCSGHTGTIDPVGDGIAALARGGVGVYDDVNSTAPATVTSGPVSAMRFTHWQVRNLIVEAQAHGGYLGSDLDQLGGPAPAGPTFSQLLAGWIVRGEGPLATYVRSLLPPVTVASASTTVFPSIAVLAFLADIARPHGVAAAPRRTRLFDLGPYIALPASAEGGVCTDVSNWVSKVVEDVTNAVSSNGTGFLSRLWNGVVALVRGAITVTIGAITRSLLGWVTRIATIAATLMQVAALFKPWTVTLSAAPAAITLDETAGDGAFTAALDAQPIDWPKSLVDCVETLANVDLSSDAWKDAPVTWSKEVGIPGFATMTSKDATIQSDKTAAYKFQTITAPVPAADLCPRLVPDGTIGVSVSVTRTDVRQAIDKLGALIVNELPAVLRTYVLPYVQPALDSAAHALAEQLTSPRAHAVAPVSRYVEDPLCEHTPPPQPQTSATTASTSALPLQPCDRIVTNADAAAAYPGEKLLTVPDAESHPNFEDFKAKMPTAKGKALFDGVTVCYIGHLGPDVDVHHEQQQHTAASFATRPAALRAGPPFQACSDALASELAHFHATCIGVANGFAVFDDTAEYDVFDESGSSGAAFTLMKHILDHLEQ